MCFTVSLFKAKIEIIYPLTPSSVPNSTLLHNFENAKKCTREDWINTEMQNTSAIEGSRFSWDVSVVQDHVAPTPH